MYFVYTKEAAGKINEDTAIAIYETYEEAKKRAIYVSQLIHDYVYVGDEFDSTTFYDGEIESEI